MIRKLSVASITSNFAKRSGSITSLHRRAEEDALADFENLKTSPSREHNSSDSIKPGEFDDLSWSRLSVIQDEKENILSDSFETLPNMKFGPNGSPSATMRRLATLKMKRSWAPDGQRIITPPLRTSSANSTSQVRNVTPLSTVTDAAGEDKENAPQAKPVESATGSQKLGKKSKGVGKNRSVVAEGIRNFFR
jgi:hypothetical protein